MAVGLFLEDEPATKFGATMAAKYAIALAALAVSASLPAHAAKPSDSYRVTNTLCSEPGYAVELEAARAAGVRQEMAIDAVGKRAGGAVCAFYAGRAVIAERRTVTKDGILYRLTKWLFVKDGRGAWVAESGFAQENGAEPL